MEKKAEIVDFSTFFVKNDSCACVYAKKIVPLLRKCAFCANGKRKSMKKLLKNINLG